MITPAILETWPLPKTLDQCLVVLAGSAAAVGKAYPPESREYEKSMDALHRWTAANITALHYLPEG